MAPLGCDHALVYHEVLVISLATQVVARRPGRSARVGLRVGRWFVQDFDALQFGVIRAMGRSDPMDPVRTLEQVCQHACAKLKVARYSDPPEIKELCRLRGIAVAASERGRLSQKIQRLRRVARTAWVEDLVVRAACGDWKARQLLASPAKKSHAFETLRRASGSTERAVQRVRAHYDAKFEAPALNSTYQWQRPGYSTEPAVAVDELHWAVAALKKWQDLWTQWGVH